MNRQEFTVIVATQCVEAGVDIDVDEIVRDFAPWDSLMQVCGRANRYARRPCASVWVYRWVDDSSEHEREFASYIYDDVVLDATLSVLKGNTEIKERDYFKLQEQYIYELETKKRLSYDVSRKIITKTLSWEFSEIDEFRRLFREGDAVKISIFCAADDVAEDLKETGTLLWSSKDLSAAILKLEKLIESERFRPLSEFLKVKPEALVKIVRGIKSKDDRMRRLELQRILRPMFHAYTISVTQKTIDDVGGVSYISEDFPYLDRMRYRLLSGQLDQFTTTAARYPDNID